MNGASLCHEIPGCPGLFMDAFRGPYLNKTSEARNVFVLTHYHGDHYGNLPKDGNYHGPAQIHCTVVTAALLRTIHQVPAALVVEHEYGETWEYPLPVRATTGVVDKNNNDKKDLKSAAAAAVGVVKITFYDANHCPGAAIVVLEMPHDDGKIHLHTGDMRYHAQMKLYPLLQRASAHRLLDLLFLDTTYGNPKHDFVPQEEAIETIAAQTLELLGPCRQQQTQTQTIEGTTTAAATTPNTCMEPTASTLVLLSCYSIGKERVLWEASTRTNQKVYVSEKKFRMLQCIQQLDNNNNSSNIDHDPHHQQQPHVSSQIIQRCTRNPAESDIHVIPMGMAGAMWPFFRPNFNACVEYARNILRMPATASANNNDDNNKDTPQQQQQKQYNRIFAFVPTGWADASNWNKKNAVSTATIDGIHVEIRLISYSEHSSYSELQEFVQFLRPRKVIPTVFKDEKDLRKLQARFPVDNHRAKQHFFGCSNNNNNASGSGTKVSASAFVSPAAAAKAAVSDLSQVAAQPRVEEETEREENDDTIESSPTAVSPSFSPTDAARNDGVVVAVSPWNKKRSRQEMTKNVGNDNDNMACTENVSLLQAMGFAKDDAHAALRACAGNVQDAIEKLLLRCQSSALPPSPCPAGVGTGTGRPPNRAQPQEQPTTMTPTKSKSTVKPQKKKQREESKHKTRPVSQNITKFFKLKKPP